MFISPPNVKKLQGFIYKASAVALKCQGANKTKNCLLSLFHFHLVQTQILSLM